MIVDVRIMMLVIRILLHFFKEYCQGVHYCLILCLKNKFNPYNANIHVVVKVKRNYFIEFVSGKSVSSIILTSISMHIVI